MNHYYLNMSQLQFLFIFHFLGLIIIFFTITQGNEVLNSINQLN